MGIAYLVQILTFTITHLPQIIASVQAITAFFKAHRNHPDISTWMTEFSQVLTLCKTTKDPKPLQDFLARISENIKTI